MIDNYCHFQFSSNFASRFNDYFAACFYTDTYCVDAGWVGKPGVVHVLDVGARAAVEEGLGSGRNIVAASGNRRDGRFGFRQQPRGEPLAVGAGQGGQGPCLHHLHLKQTKTLFTSKTFQTVRLTLGQTKSSS